jgi:chaperonin GroES
MSAKPGQNPATGPHRPFREPAFAKASQATPSKTIRSENMKLRPLHDRVIVKRLEEERKTASGIVIPDTAAEKPDQGEVLAVGPGKKNEDGKVTAVDVKVGDKVLFGKYSGSTVRVDGDELLVMREEDIMAVVN